MLVLLPFIKILLGSKLKANKTTLVVFCAAGFRTEEVICFTHDRCYVVGRGGCQAHSFHWKVRVWCIVDSQATLKTNCFVEVLSNDCNVPLICDFDGSYNLASTLWILTRIIKAELFVKAIHKPTKANQTPLRVKEVYRFEEISKIFDRWDTIDTRQPILINY